MNAPGTTGTVSLSQIGQIAVYVENLDRAVAFYRDTLGMTFLFQVPNLAFFDCNGVRLMLDRPSEPESAGLKRGTSIIYYKVDDLQQAHATLTQRGVEWSHPPHLVAPMPDHDLWMAFLKDTEGNSLALMSEVRPPAPRG